MRAAPPAQVTFDEKSAVELLSMLNAILASLDAAHRVDVREERPEATAARMCGFLLTLNYRFPTPDGSPCARRRASPRCEAAARA